EFGWHCGTPRMVRACKESRRRSRAAIAWFGKSARGLLHSRKDLRVTEANGRTVVRASWRTHGRARKEIGSVRQRAGLLLGLGVLMTAWGPRLRADQAAAPSAYDKLTDYRGKGEISISIQPAQASQQPVNMLIPMEQAFRKPGTFLVTVNLVVRQTFLA